MEQAFSSLWPWALALAAVIVPNATPACGDTLDLIKQRGTLIWGADAEGGGPFVYPRDDDPTEYQGFEVEIAGILAEKLGVTASFKQGQWDKLPDLLKRGDVDIVLNGYEWTPIWAERYGTTIPYYVYQLQMMVRANDDRFQSIADLGNVTGGRPKIAVLGGSAAQTYLKNTFKEQVDLFVFEGNVNAMRAVELNINGVDATLQDLPIVTYYEQRFPALRRLDEPVAPGYYVALTRLEDTRLLQRLNSAILESLQDGAIPAVLEKYRLWNAMQVQRGLLTNEQGSFRRDLDVSPSVDDSSLSQKEPRAVMLLRRIPLLLQGAVVTVFLSVISMPLAVATGLSIAVGRLYGPAWLRRVLGTYVEVVRGTPLVLQLYVIFFLLPELGLSFPPLVAAILGLSLNYSAYEAEIYRAGLQAIPRGQMEAALSLGMSKSLALRRIIVPQAFRLVIPPVMNDFIALFKDTAVCSVITIEELSKRYYIHAQSADAVVELGIVTALLYMAMSYPLALIVSRMERRLAEGAKH
ncbi:MAG: ABC transporter substrate-binding protein/permease [Pirellulaceae bacterium]